MLALLAVICACMLSKSPPGYSYVDALCKLTPRPRLAMELLRMGIHLTIFFMLAMGLAFTFSTARPQLTINRVTLMTLLAVGMVGGMMELIQIHIPQRCPSVSDVITDLMGGVVYFCFLRNSPGR